MKYTSCEVYFIRRCVTLKNLIKKYRCEIDMTQAELASRVNVSSRTIISLEKGYYNPSLMLAYRIALVFGTTIEKIFCLEENKESEDK